MIGHCGDTDDLDYLKELMDAGSTIGMDRFGIDVYLPTDERVRVVAELCEQGYADRMVLSHDAPCFIDWFPQEVMDMSPNWRFTHISDDVLPAMPSGVTDDDIDQMLVGNPRRVFETIHPYGGQASAAPLGHRGHLEPFRDLRRLGGELSRGIRVHLTDRGGPVDPEPSQLTFGSQSLVGGGRIRKALAGFLGASHRCQTPGQRPRASPGG